MELVLVIATIAAGYDYLMHARAIPTILRDYPTDFRIMFEGAEKIRTHALPYDLIGLRTAPFEASYIYPPFFAGILSAWTPIGFLPVAYAWLAMNQVFYSSSFLLLLRDQGIAFRSLGFYLLLIMALLFQPAFDSMRGGQMDSILLFLLVVVWVSSRSRRCWAAGAALALATMLKLYPGLLVLYFLVRRQWKSLAWFAATMVGLTMVSVILVGWTAHRVFVLEVLPLIGRGTAWFENQSFFGFFSRLVVDGMAVDPTRPTDVPFASIASRVASVATVGVSAFLGLRGRNETAIFAVFVTFPLLVLPNAWMHYELILILPLILLLIGRDGMKQSPWAVVVLAIAALLVGVGRGDTIRSHSWIVQSYKFLGVLMIWTLGILRSHDGYSKENVAGSMKRQDLMSPSRKPS